MSELPGQSVRLVRVMPEEEVVRIASVLPIRTSCRLNWSGVEVHQYRTEPHEIPEHSFPYLTVFISHTAKPGKSQVCVAGRNLTATLKSGSVSIAPPGMPIRARYQASPREFTAIFIDPFILAEAAAADAGACSIEIEPQYGIDDPFIREIGRALDTELISPSPKPPVFAKSLAIALSGHILARYGEPASIGSWGSLNNCQLRRSIEFMHDNLHRQLRLPEIAAAANMSKYHFAKSFRRATGMAPHRYLMDIRVAKARELLVHSDLSIEEIAYRVGYMDRSHFRGQFLSTVGTTPGRYRRELNSPKRIVLPAASERAGSIKGARPPSLG